MHSLYVLASGELTGFRLAGSQEDRDANTPAGHGWIEGAFDSRCFVVEQHVDDFGDAFPRAAPRTPPRPSDNAYQTWAWDDAAGDWVAQPTSAWRAAQVRAQRDRLLAASDWTQGRDVPAATSAAWAPYRQALRDITAQPGFPDSITWPIAPAA